ALPTRSRRKYSCARRTWPCRMTSIFSIRGLWILNVRSTPTPLAIRRTVIERVIPPPRRRITMPSKTWIRSRLPSTTLAETLTVSPEASSGRSVRSWSETSSSRTFTSAFLVSCVGSPKLRVGHSRGKAERIDRRRSIAWRPRAPGRPWRRCPRGAAVAKRRVGHPGRPRPRDPPVRLGTEDRASPASRLRRFHRPRLESPQTAVSSDREQPRVPPLEPGDWRIAHARSTLAADGRRPAGGRRPDLGAGHARGRHSVRNRRRKRPPLRRADGRPGGERQPALAMHRHAPVVDGLPDRRPLRRGTHGPYRDLVLGGPRAARRRLSRGRRQSLRRRHGLPVHRRRRRDPALA